MVTIDRDNVRAQRFLAGRDTCPPRLLAALARSSHWEVRYAVAARADRPPSLIPSPR